MAIGITKVATMLGVLFAGLGCGASHVTYEGCQPQAVCDAARGVLLYQTRQDVAMGRNWRANATWKESIGSSSLICEVRSAGSQRTTLSLRINHQFLIAAARDEVQEKQLLGTISEQVLRTTSARIVEASGAELAGIKPVPVSVDGDRAATVVSGISMEQAMGFMREMRAAAGMWNAMYEVAYLTEEMPDGLRVSYAAKAATATSHPLRTDVSFALQPTAGGVRIEARRERAEGSLQEGVAADRAGVVIPPVEMRLRGVVLPMLGRFPSASARLE